MSSMNMMSFGEGFLQNVLDLRLCAYLGFVCLCIGQGKRCDCFFVCGVGQRLATSSFCQVRESELLGR